MNDLSFAARTLRKHSGFTLAAIVTLALGVGANTAIFSVVKAVLLDPLPYPEPDRLVKIATSDPDTPRPTTVDFTTTFDLRARSRSFQTMSLYRDAAGAVVDRGEPELVQGMRVNADYFDTLGVTPALGRTFLAEEDRPDRRFAVILTDGLWKRRFGGDPQILGRVVRFNEASFTVVGVLPASFRPLARSDGAILPDMYMPLGYDLKDSSACRGCQHLQLIARLKPGVSVEQAESELNALMRGIVSEHPGSYNRDAAVTVTPLREFLVGRVGTAVLVLLGAVGFVLLIACTNVANLVLARATAREQEMAVRAALGAGRGRLVLQQFTESALLALCGGLAGVMLAWWGTDLVSRLGPNELPRVSAIEIDAGVLLFAVAVSLATGLLVGLVPALRGSRVDLTDALRASSRSSESGSRQLVRKMLVISEVALAFVLVVGAGLLGRSFVRLTGVDPGYDPHHVLTLGVYVYGARYQAPEAELNYYAQVMNRLRATAGIESVAMVSTLPLGGFDRRGFHILDRPLANVADAPSADTYSVSSDYFRVMKIPLKRGRFFDDRDRRGAPGVAVISESCARLQFPGENPIGKRIQLGGRDEKNEWLEIVGIVGDVRQYGLDRSPAMEAYIHQPQNLNFGYNLVARTGIDPARLENTVREVFLSVDSTQPVFRVRPLEAYLSESLATRSFTLTLIAAFGVLALALAGVGIYGVVSYTVSLRTREVGIRMALGASRRAVLTMVLQQGLQVIGTGLAAGLCASLVLTRFLSTLLYEIKATDVTTFAAVAVVLIVVALAANYLPARRASNVDPIIALRYE
jgi:putative ABC transport system permease protein